jgi:hypothetical protein
MPNIPMTTPSLTLTIAQIIDLAAFAGLVFKEGCDPDDDALETELTIQGCPAIGVLDDDDDSVTRRHYEHIAYFTEYPEEGWVGLGKEVSNAAI